MKKDLIIAVLLTFCLISTLFMIIPTDSSVGDYDPWLDFNDDGKIDIKDIALSARAYGTYGDSTKNVTVTNFPTDSIFPTKSAPNIGNLGFVKRVLALPPINRALDGVGIRICQSMAFIDEA